MKHSGGGTQLLSDRLNGFLRGLDFNKGTNGSFIQADRSGVVFRGELVNFAEFPIVKLDPEAQCLENGDTQFPHFLLVFPAPLFS